MKLSQDPSQKIIPGPIEIINTNTMSSPRVPFFVLLKETESNTFSQYIIYSEPGINMQFVSKRLSCVIQVDQIETMMVFSKANPCVFPVAVVIKREKDFLLPLFIVVEVKVK